MEKQIKKLYRTVSLLNSSWNTLLTRFLFLLIILISTSAYAQNNRSIKGVVLDEKQDPVIGATIIVKGSTIGTITDIKGEFSLVISPDNQIIVVSYIGMETQEIDMQDKDNISIVLKESAVKLEDVVVVGYGKQKKESIVGSITQTTGKILERSGGVTNVGQALTGNLPGVITIQSTGKPGEEDPAIFIRGQGTWNYSDPLILIDGIERPLSGVDISSIESVSVLKDASATAVFGVKGANGVILITTKRGTEGKANISVTAGATMKIYSKLPEKYDSYDALSIRNDVIERELPIKPESWADYTSQEILNKYRYPANLDEAERYPNVDWLEESLKKSAMSYNGNINISGGASFVKYFTSMDMLSEGDILKVRENDKGYKPSYGYNRINVRSNLDFKLTKTTTLSTNLFGSYAMRQNTWSDFDWAMWQTIYSNPPDVFMPRYSNGVWGANTQNEVAAGNSVALFSNSGIRKTKTTSINTDFTLTQDLGMILKGLNVKATLSMDNRFTSEGGLYDDGVNIISGHMNTDGSITYAQRTPSRNQFGYSVNPWEIRTDAMRDWLTYRKTFYQVQLNYATKINNHNITTMGLFSRDKYATGSEFPYYREDWVFRLTYDYRGKYFVESNGAYNGSEKFSQEYRFDFFPSIALGWMVSEEEFMKNIEWLNRLKIRWSYGQVGNDNIQGFGRWLYMTQWAYEGTVQMGSLGTESSPYTIYKEKFIGNTDVHWETVTKRNFGADFSFFRGLVEGNVDFFNDYRFDILIAGGSRSVPDYFGGTAPVANLGKTKVKGYEFEIKLNHRFSNGLRLWANTNMTHAKDNILEADDAQLLDSYLKKQGHQIGQYYTQVRSGYYNTWDEVYGSTELNTYDVEKLPGNYHIVDYNGDGIIDNYDNVPYGFPERPQNTYSLTTGFEYKGFSAFVQFYGVSNVTRNVTMTSFANHLNAVFKQGDYWTKDNPDAPNPYPRWNSHMDYAGDRYAYDGSYLRLKTAEIAYNLESSWIKKKGIKSMRIYLNGNNLLLWTKMPDDRESNLGTYSGQGTYPTVRRINLGVNVVF
jgi:TonB-linked SusC/RagA family outer membrane protein